MEVNQYYVLQVHLMGKPDPIIYEVALDMLQLPRESIVAIGDSLQHDIQGTVLGNHCMPSANYCELHSHMLVLHSMCYLNSCTCSICSRDRHAWKYT